MRIADASLFVAFLVLVWISRALFDMARYFLEDWEWPVFKPKRSAPEDRAGPPPPTDVTVLTVAEPIEVAVDKPPPKKPANTPPAHHSSTPETAANTNVECPFLVARDAVIAELEADIAEYAKNIETDVFDEESCMRTGNYGEARRAERRADATGLLLMEARNNVRYLKAPSKVASLDKLMTWTGNAPGGEVPVYALMREDCWETRFGDGYYIYFRDAFLEHGEAKIWAHVRDRAEPGTKHHIIALAFRVDDGENGAKLALSHPAFERAHVCALTIAEAVIEG